jgi:hypothetical protein
VILELTGGFGLPDDLDRSFGTLVDAVVSGIAASASASASASIPS